MKHKFTKYLAFAFLSVFLFTACDLFNNDDDNEKPQDRFLVSYEMVKSYLPDYINLVFNSVASDNPQINFIQENIKNGVIVYKIKYNTVFKGQLKIASGLVCVPTGGGSYPVLSYQNGTNTLHSEAPSVNPDNDLFLLLEFVASTGFIVVMPDYLGFGETQDMFHPYLHKESTVQVVLDMLRATKELNANYLEIEQNDKLYIAGYSQGGWATMQVQKEIETIHAGEFNLQASACGAGPYDLNYINNYVTQLTTYPMPYFLAYMIDSYTRLGDVTTPITEIFQEPYATKVPTLFDGSKSGEELNAELSSTIEYLFTNDYINNSTTDAKYASVVSTLTKNSVTAWKTTTPTMIIHGMNDDFVPRQVSSNLYQDFLKEGIAIDKVTWLPLPGYGHQTGIVPSGLASIKWFIELEKESGE